jgi:hypothetical protein
VTDRDRFVGLSELADAPCHFLRDAEQLRSDLAKVAPVERGIAQGYFHRLSESRGHGPVAAGLADADEICASMAGAVRRRRARRPTRDEAECEAAYRQRGDESRKASSHYR